MSDLDRLADDWVQLATDQRAHGSHLEADANRETIRDAISRHVISGDLLVARDDDTDAIVGFVMFGLETGTFDQDLTRGVVYNVFVTPDRRRDGIGSMLLDEAERALADDGADVLSLEVMADNDAARRLYRERGYRPHRIELEKRAENDTHSKE